MIPKSSENYLKCAARRIALVTFEAVTGIAEKENHEK